MDGPNYKFYQVDLWMKEFVRQKFLRCCIRNPLKDWASNTSNSLIHDRTTICWRLPWSTLPKDIPENRCQEYFQNIEANSFIRWGVLKATQINNNFPRIFAEMYWEIAYPNFLIVSIKLILWLTWILKERLVWLISTLMFL